MPENLGLHRSPDYVEYIFVGEADGDEGPTAWYKLDFDTNRQIPISEDAITGYINNVTVFNKPYKGKDNYKLNIHITGDIKYVVRAGVGTTFARGFIISLTKLLAEKPEALQGLITVTVKKASESKAFFCGMYYKGSKIIGEWDSESLSDRIASIQESLGQVVQTKDLMDDHEKYYEAQKELRAGREAQARPQSRRIRKSE